MAQDGIERGRRDGRRETYIGRVRAWRAAADDALVVLTEATFGASARLRQVERLTGGNGSGRGQQSGSTAELERAARARLLSALRAERRRCRARHWTYDFNRHVALLQALGAMPGAEPHGTRPDQRKTPPGGPDGA